MTRLISLPDGICHVIKSTIIIKIWPKMFQSLFPVKEYVVGTRTSIMQVSHFVHFTFLCVTASILEQSHTFQLIYHLNLFSAHSWKYWFVLFV